MPGSAPDGSQGGPAAVEDGKLEEQQVLDPRRLYLLWESRHWAASGLDFEQDRDDWARLPEDRRALLVHSVAPFFVGEERVAAAFAPILLAADDEQEAAFLSTQQVDEARHMQFFDRFWREVFFPDGDFGRTAVDDARRRCNEAFTELIDRRLMEAVDRLRLNPSDVDAKVEAVAIYHLLVEGTLALTGMHFILDYLERHSILPGITTGFRNVTRDEHRHVAWGTWFLRQKCRQDDHYGSIVQNVLMALLPIAAGVMVKGGGARCDGLDACEFLDYRSVELNHFCLQSLGRRLKVIGGATEEVQRFVGSGVWRAERLL